MTLVEFLTARWDEAETVALGPPRPGEESVHWGLIARRFGDHVPERLLKRLAIPFSDHPDYQAGWTP